MHYGIVASVYGANEDGQIFLYKETEKIIALTYEEAVKYITKLAADLEYLTAVTAEATAKKYIEDARKERLEK